MDNIESGQVAEPEAEAEAEPEAEGLTDPSLELCSVNCTKDLLKHINSKKRKLDLYRKILEIKYNRYKICYSSWSLTTIFLSTILTLIESCKLIFLDADVHDKILIDFFDLTPIVIGTFITGSSSIVKFKKYQEKMETFSNVIEKCVSMGSKLRNNKELLELKNSCYDSMTLNEMLQKYKEEILPEYLIIYQESQKYIKTADYDRYARLINNSEIHKHIIEEERMLFYKKYKPSIDLEEVTDNAENCYKYKCCCF